MLISVIKTMVSHGGVMVLSILTSLILIPLLLVSYGQDGLGSYWVVLSTVSVMGFLEFGLLTTSSKFYAMAVGGNQGQLWASTARLLKRYVAILLVLLLLASLLVYTLVIGEPIGIQDAWLADAKLLFITLAATLGLSIFTIPFSAKLQAFEHIQTLYFSQFLNSFFRFFLSLAVVWFDQPLWLLGAVALFTTMISSGYQIFFANRIQTIPQNGAGEDLSWKKMFVVMLPISILMLGDLLRFTMDNMIVGAFLGTALVAVYGVGFLPAELIKQAMAPFSRFFMVWASQDAGRDEYHHERLFKFSDYAGVPIAIVCTATAASAPVLIQLWMGDAFVDEASVVLAVLMFGFLFALPQAGVTGHLIGTGKQWPLAWLTLAEGAVNLLLTLLLVSHLGLLGVAIGTCIPMVISKGFVQPWLLAKHHHLAYWYVWRHLLLAPLLWAMLVFGVLAWPAWQVQSLWEYMAYFMLVFGIAGVPVLRRMMAVWKLRHG